MIYRLRMKLDFIRMKVILCFFFLNIDEVWSVVISDANNLIMSGSSDGFLKMKPLVNEW